MKKHTGFLKRIIAVLFVSIIAFLTFANEAVANEIKNYNNKKQMTIGEIGGYLEGSLSGVNNIFSERNFTEKVGHGYAAEKANNLSDVFKLRNASVVGGDNAKNGPDRKIINRDGSITYIQDKYHKTANESVNDAFDKKSGSYRYYDSKGNPMQLEVPADQYEKAIEIMKEKIRKGEVPGVTDPNKAYELVRKGKYTYQQAVNITKAGNIDSLKYDATNGAVIAVCAMGMTFVLDYVSCKINGIPNDEAVRTAGLNCMKTGSVVFASYVISSQLAKTGLKNFLTPTAEAVAKHLSSEVQKTILKTFGVEISKKAAEKTIVTQVANILSTQLIFDAVFVVVLTLPKVIELFSGRISKEQLLKDLAVTVVSIAGATAGSVAGTAIGSAIAPGIGSAVGKVLGGVIGGAVSGLTADYIADKFYKGDAEIMFDIISEEFQKLCVDFLITEKEADNLVNQLQKLLDKNKVKDMFKSKDRKAFAVSLMEPLFVEQVRLRDKITIPLEEETRYCMKQSLQGIVFVH